MKEIDSGAFVVSAQTLVIGEQHYYYASGGADDEFAQEQTVANKIVDVANAAKILRQKPSHISILCCYHYVILSCSEALKLPKHI